MSGGQRALPPNWQLNSSVFGSTNFRVDIHESLQNLTIPNIKDYGTFVFIHFMCLVVHQAKTNSLSSLNEETKGASVKACTFIMWRFKSTLQNIKKLLTEYLKFIHYKNLNLFNFTLNICNWYQQSIKIHTTFIFWFYWFGQIDFSRIRNYKFDAIYTRFYNCNYKLEC